MRSSKKEKKPKIWKTTQPVRFNVIFWPLYILGFAASWGTSWGWIQMMDNCCKDTRGKDDFSFFAWILILCVFYWTTVDILYYRKLYRLFLKTLSAFYSVYESLFENSPHGSEVATMLSLMRDDGTELNMTYMQTMREVAIALLVAMYLFIWQHGNDSYTHEEAENMTKHFMSQNETTFVTSQLLEEFLIRVNIAEDPSMTRKLSNIRDDIHFSYARKMVSVVRERIQVMIKAQMIPDTTLVNTRLETLCSYITEFELALETAPLPWISFATKVIGLTMSFLLPPVFYATMGWKIFYTGPAMFMIVGGLVLFNLCCGDIFTFHTSIYMGKIYDYMIIVTAKMQSMFAVKFKTVMDNTIKQLQEQSFYTNITKQQLSLALANTSSPVFLNNVTTHFIRHANQDTTKMQ